MSPSSTTKLMNYYAWPTSNLALFPELKFSLAGEVEYSSWKSNASSKSYSKKKL